MLPVLCPWGISVSSYTVGVVITGFIHLTGLWRTNEMIWWKHFVSCHLRVSYSPLPSPQSWQVPCPSINLDLIFTNQNKICLTLCWYCVSLLWMSAGGKSSQLDTLFHTTSNPSSLLLFCFLGFRDSRMQCQRSPRILYSEPQRVAIKTADVLG